MIETNYWLDLVIWYFVLLRCIHKTYMFGIVHVLILVANRTGLAKRQQLWCLKEVLWQASAAFLHVNHCRRPYGISNISMTSALHLQFIFCFDFHAMASRPVVALSSSPLILFLPAQVQDLSQSVTCCHLVSLPPGAISDLRQQLQQVRRMENTESIEGIEGTARTHFTPWDSGKPKDSLAARNENL